MGGWTDGWAEGGTDILFIYLFIYYLYIRNFKRILENRIIKLL